MGECLIDPTTVSHPTEINALILTERRILCLILIGLSSVSHLIRLKCKSLLAVVEINCPLYFSSSFSQTNKNVYEQEKLYN